jgi:RNA polymerase sigma-70 factor (ECF subfamily)
VRQLFDRCVTGDSQAWRDLHRAYYPTACRFLTHLGVGAADLDDACQDVFVQVFRYLGRFQHRADFPTWLYKLCLTQASRLRRRRKLQQALSWLLGRGSAGHTEAASPEGGDVLAAERVHQVLARMRPIYREVFVLFELEDMSGEDIARILGCPTATVRRRLHYARKEFEQLFGGAVTGAGRSP